MNLSGVMTQLIALFMMMFIGFVTAKAGLITPEFRRKLSALALATAAPCTILGSAISGNIAGGEMLIVLGVACLCYAALVVLAALLVHLARVKPEEKKLDQLMLIFTNVGFMGIPVVESLYGATGVAMVSMFILCFNVMFYSYGVMLICGSVKFDVKVLKNPCIFAALGALFFALTGFSLPAPIVVTLNSVGAMNTPLAMLIIGASLCHSDLRAALTNPRLYRVSMMRMIIVPACILALVKLLPVSPMLAGVTVIMAAMPVAGNCALLSDLYTPEDMTASHGVIISTLMSALTLPLVCIAISLAL